MGRDFTSRWIVAVVAVVVVASVAMIAAPAHTPSPRGRDRIHPMGEDLGRRVAPKPLQRRIDWHILYPGPPDGTNGVWSADYSHVERAPDHGGDVSVLDEPVGVAYDDGAAGLVFQMPRTVEGELPAASPDILALTPPADAFEDTISFVEPLASVSSPLTLPPTQAPPGARTWRGLMGAGSLGEFGDLRFVAYAEGHLDPSTAGGRATADLVIADLVTDVEWEDHGIPHPQERLRIRNAWQEGRRAGPVSIWRDTVAYPEYSGGQVTWHLYDDHLRPVDRRCTPLTCRAGRATRFLTGTLWQEAEFKGGQRASVSTWTGMGSTPVSPATGAPTWGQVANAEVPAICGHLPTRLEGGRNVTIGPGTGYMQLERVREGRPGIVRGIESDDGGLLTAVVLSCSGGGVPWENPIAFFGAGGRFYGDTWMMDGPWEKYGLDAPARQGVIDMTIDGGQLKVHLRVYKIGEATCCYSGQANVWIAARDHKLVITRLERLPDLEGD